MKPELRMKLDLTYSNALPVLAGLVVRLQVRASTDVVGRREVIEVLRELSEHDHKHTTLIVGSDTVYCTYWAYRELKKSDKITKRFRITADTVDTELKARVKS